MRRSRKIILALSIVLLFLLAYAGFFFSAVRTLSKQDKLGYLIPGLVQVITGIDVVTNATLSQDDFVKLIDKAEYIRIEMNESLRKEIRETGKVCVSLGTVSVKEDIPDTPHK